MEQNKTAKYFKYAIGEILLVMIGILLAFQVNNWRDQYMQNKREAKTIELLIRDLKADRKALNRFQIYLKRGNEDIIQLMNKMKNDDPNDTLVRSIWRATRSWNYRPTYPTYKGLVQGNNMDIITEDTIRDQIIDYFDETILYLDDLRSNYKQADTELDKAFEPYILYDYSTSSKNWFATSIANKKAMINDVKLQSRIANYGSRTSWLSNRIDSLFLVENKNVKENLNTYLKHLVND